MAINRGQADSSTGKAVDTAQEILEELKTVDGAGSGLDADTIQSFKPTKFAYRENNLSDLVNVATARTNLSVDSSSEVDTKIANHTSRTDNPHSVVASQVSISDSGANFTATDVENALAEEADARQAHEADTTNPHGVTAAQAGAVSLTGDTITGDTTLKGPDTTVDGGSNNSPAVVWEGSYDSDGTTGVVSTPRKMSVRNAVAADGSYQLEFLDDAGVSQLAINDTGQVDILTGAGNTHIGYREESNYITHKDIGDTYIRHYDGVNYINDVVIDGSGIVTFLNQPAFRAYQGTAQSIAAATYTKALFQTEEFDVGGNYDPVNSAFTLPEDGIYLISASMHWSGATMASGDRVFTTVYVDGAEHSRLGDLQTSGNSLSSQGSALVKGTKGQVVTIRIYATAATDTIAASHVSYFSATKVA